MHAIGSSYLIRQSAGAERYGGATVRVRPKREDVAKLEVIASDWRTEKPIADDITFLTNAAITGVKKFCSEYEIDIAEWDIDISRFAYHPVDSGPLTTQIAAYNAMASAFSSWNGGTTRKPIRDAG